ncbi:hypothetical protein ACOZ4L_02775 [Haloplanus ruber]|uniref:MAE-28990/MAE-18760-like HEPN domain-containing protein n=1 Tax=Haloplanus ruber TaxID=869892 RepID=A0ABD6D1V2_9EURY|nr:hypothetical protein [Haloplanus ruber]
MTRDLDSEDLDYRALDAPWFYARSNIYERIFRLHTIINEIANYIDELKEFDEAYTDADESVTREQTREAKLAVRQLMEHTDAVKWNFPEIVHESWFSSFTSDLAHAYWRVEEGRFRNPLENEQQLYSLAGEVQRICRNLSDSRQTGFYTHLQDYIERLDWDLNSPTPDRFEDEAREAADLFCLGYYSTALIVLGRAIEKALLDLGETRQIRSVHVYGEERPWSETKFYHKNVALKRVDMPNESGKVLSKRQFHEISILVDYRNNVAHAEYSDISRDKALRQCQNAFDLLREIEEIRDALCDLSDDKIKPITQQKVQ